jgi:hypothetical protein
MVALAVKLSDAGVLDCWDDVDQYVRNQLVEQQAADPDLLLAAAQAARSLGTGASPTSTDRALERSLGAFSAFGEPTCLPRSDFHGCCTGNGTQALYYAWEGVTRLEGEVARVNLWLNRAAPWLDVDSYLPYEGKLVVRNKQATTLAIRIPGWVDRAHLCCRLGERTITPFWVGSHIVFAGLRPGDEVSVECPVPEEEATYTANGTRYACTFRGSTLVDIAPRNAPPASYPIYRREHQRTGKAPAKATTRFVTDRLIHW